MKYKLSFIDYRINPSDLDDWSPVYNVIVDNDGNYIATTRDEGEARELIKILNQLEIL